MRALRVSFVAPFGLWRRGTTRARVIPLAKALAELGHQVRVVIPDWDCPADAGRRYRVGGAEVVHLGAALANRVLLSPRLLHQTYRAALDGRPDIVHCFKPIGYSGAVALLLGGRARRQGWAGTLAVDTDDLEGRDGWATRDGRPSWQVRLLECQERAVVRAADLLSCASVALVEAARSHRANQTAPTYLPNGVDLPACTPPGRKHQAHDHSPPRLLMYTRFNEFTPARGAAIVADILKSAPAARLEVVGDGPAAARAAFLVAIARQGLARRVRHRGLLTGSELGEALTGDAVALWLFDDNAINRARSPAKLLELLAYGKALVAEAIGEVPGLVGDAAVLTTLTAPAETVRATVELLSMPERCAELGCAARRRAGAHATWRSRARALVSSYLLYT
ncbi:MAG TPA: glycosyltransferase [Chloroflexota bacterium]